jgi:RNA polymerase sigma-70 factor (ECF subfamily)
MAQQHENLSDYELVQLYTKQRDEQAFETLVRRYYRYVMKRFITKVNQTEAEDLSQQLWIRVLGHLDSYQDEGKFTAFLSTIARNLLNDHWRKAGVRAKVDVEWDEEGLDHNAQFSSHTGSAEDEYIRQSAVRHLTCELIPALPCSQRMIYLLRHESEYWEEKSRLEWNNLAELNGIDVATAWSRFDSARAKFLKRLSNANSDIQNGSEVDDEELLMFLVWTQAQRPDKAKKYTEAYFADLLSVPVSTLKTRYQAASKQLASGMSEWRDIH